MATVHDLPGHVVLHASPRPGWVLSVLVGLTSLSVLAEPRTAEYPLIGLLEGALILGLAVAGALLIDDEAQRGNGLLLLAVGALLGVMHLHLVGDSPFPLMGWVAGPLAAVTVAVVLLRFPGSRLSDAGRRWAAGAVILLVVSRVTVTIPPARLREGWWPALPFPESVSDSGLKLGNAYLAALMCWFIALMTSRLRNSKGLSRYELAPVVFASLGGAAAILAHVVSVFSGYDQIAVSMLVVEQVGLLAVPAGFIFAALRMRAARGAVADLLLRVRASSTPLEIQEALARTLADDDLTIYLWASEEDHWRAPTGLRAEPAAGPGQMTIPVDAEDGSPLAVIVTDASIARHGQLVGASAAAVRLALHNAAVMELLRRSRTRLAEAEVAERRRLERDLHDGVQQRLLALGMSMDRVVRAAPDENTRQLAAIAAVQVHEAIAELRDLARGILPAVLTQSGLDAAVESATERLPLNVTRNIPTRRWPAATEATAYFVICEALTNVVKHAHCDRAEVEVTDDASTLLIRVHDSGRGGARHSSGGSGLLGIRDRVTALGGALTVDSTEGAGTCLTVRLPYA